MAPLFKLSPDETLRMVQEYKKHELLHNKSHELYKDLTARRSALKSIGDVLQLNKPVNEISRKLKSLRSTFILEQNKKKENNEYIPKLIWYNEMASFIPFTPTGKSRICTDEQSIDGQLPPRHDVTRRRLKRLTVSRRRRGTPRNAARRMVKPPMSMLLAAASNGQPSLQYAASRHKAVRFEKPDLKTIRKENASVDEQHVGTELASVEDVEKNLSCVNTKEMENSQKPVKVQNCDEVSLGSGDVQSTLEVEEMGSQTYKNSTRSIRTRTQTDHRNQLGQGSAEVQTNRKRKTSDDMQTDLPDEAELSRVEIESSEDEDLAVVTQRRSVGVNRPGRKKILPPSYLGAARGGPPLPPQRYATLVTVPASIKKRLRSIENGVSENPGNSTSLAAKTQSQGPSSYQALANGPGLDSQEISETSETSQSEDDLLTAFGKFINLSSRKLDIDSFLIDKEEIQRMLNKYRACVLQEMANTNNMVTDDSGQPAKKNKTLLLQALNTKPKAIFKVLVKDDDEYDAFTYEIVHQLRMIPGYLKIKAQFGIMSRIITSRMPLKFSDEEERASGDESALKERILSQEKSNRQEQGILNEECPTEPLVAGRLSLRTSDEEESASKYESTLKERCILRGQSKPKEQETLDEESATLGEALYQEQSSQEGIVFGEQSITSDIILFQRVNTEEFNSPGSLSNIHTPQLLSPLQDLEMYNLEVSQM